ncbi:hypothetical protein HRI_001391800 [Hibiscus trionum]|uniref:Uncharacterized protein n=1 Tax=Hibiscus trionum TaxID=183268 RepID=A0A9W7LW28_HIBTR|nr:hypothetical protein HRI_001391800 [Hibiscus trionum]
MGYDFEVCYKKGINNTIAYALSTRPIVAQFRTMCVSSISTDFFKKVAESWEKDDKVKKIIRELKDGSGRHSKYSWDGRQLRRKGELVVGNSSDLKKEFLEFFHSSPTEGHSGAHSTIKKNSCTVVLERDEERSEEDGPRVLSLLEKQV